MAAPGGIGETSMSNRAFKIFAILAVLALVPGTALARPHGGGRGGHHMARFHGGGHAFHGGHFRHGFRGRHFRPGFRHRPLRWAGPGIFFAWGYPGFYGGPECGWVRVRYHRHGHWHHRRVWRCW
jgi:hypothetical protein